MLIEKAPELSTCITGCIQIAEDVCIVLFNNPIIKSSEKSKPERYEVFDCFRKFRMAIIRQLDRRQIEEFNELNVELADQLINDINLLLSLYQTELATKVKYDYIVPISYYLVANEFILLSQLYFLKLYGVENKVINNIARSVFAFGDKVENVSLNPEKKIDIKSERISQLYKDIIDKIIKISIKK